VLITWVVSNRNVMLREHLLRGEHLLSNIRAGKGYMSMRWWFSSGQEKVTCRWDDDSHQGRKRLHVNEVMILIRAGKGYTSMRWWFSSGQEKVTCWWGDDSHQGRKRLHVDEVMILIRAGKGYMSMRWWFSSGQEKVTCRWGDDSRLVIDQHVKMEF
jgi:hypothetical protein